MLTLPVLANAQPLSGLYIGGAVGTRAMQNETTTLTSRLSSGDGGLMTGPGPAASFSVGYGLANGLRAEVEGSYRYKNFKATDGASTVSGVERKYGTMVNVLYELAAVVPLVQPYVGAGVGHQWMEESHLKVAHPGMVFNGSGETHDGFAYQAIVGAALPIAAIPGLSLTADYRFMGITGSRNYNGTITYRTLHIPATVNVDGDTSHTVLVGFRYAFGKPPAPSK
jgi:opacity protein-like surface antigen